MGTLGMALVVGLLLLIFGGLIGHALSERILAYEIRRRAEFARVAGEQWRAIQAERAARRRYRCPRCGAPHASYEDDLGDAE